MGAWIEILFINLFNRNYEVAPHDGCVDWNMEADFEVKEETGRTPRWVRGLKSVVLSSDVVLIMSHPTMGAWIEILL